MNVSSVQGNSFQKKVFLLFGAGHAAESQDKSNGQGGPTQRASALATLSSTFNPSSGSRTSAPRPSTPGQGSQRAAAVATLSSVLTAEKKTKSPESSPTRSTRSPLSETSSPAATKDETFNSELEVSEEVSDIKEAGEMEPVSESNGGDSELKEDAEQDENGTESSQSTFSYDQLKAKSDNPITGIDFKRRETYLSNEEFESIFGVTKEAFYKLPKWKQDMQKRKVDLF